MHNDNEKSIFSKLQADVDAILDGIDHLFDEDGDYGRSVDPLHQIDIDEVLTTEVAKVQSYIAKRRIQKTKPADSAQPACFSPAAEEAFAHARDSYRRRDEGQTKIGDAVRTAFRRLSY